MKGAQLAVVIELSDYRAARRAAEVLRGLLRDLPGISGVSVSLEDATVTLVVVGRGLKAEIIRACVPTSVNSVPVRVVSEGAPNGGHQRGAEGGHDGLGRAAGRQAHPAVPTLRTLTVEVEKLQKDLNYWREEALLAEEQGDEEQARKYFERAETLHRRLEAMIGRESGPQ